MFNKSAIINELSKFPYEPTEYWIITGAALVLRDIRQHTSDIDLGCTTALADVLQNKGYPVKQMFNGKRWIVYSDSIELFENWGEGHAEYLNEIPVLSLDAIIAMKTELGREKDSKDLALINEYLRTHKSNR